jgi:hypothetical protein
MSWLVMLNACASTAFDPSGRTGGVELTLTVLNNEGGSAALYQVSRSGTLGFGGGMDAQIGRISWTGKMTDEQIGEFLAILERHAWTERKPVSTGEPKGLVSRINIKGPEGRKRYTLRGQCESVKEVKEFLDEVARLRFEPILRQMPLPSEPD